MAKIQNISWDGRNTRRTHITRSRTRVELFRWVWQRIRLEDFPFKKTTIFDFLPKMQSLIFILLRHAALFRSSGVLARTKPRCSWVQARWRIDIQRASSLPRLSWPSCFQEGKHPATYIIKLQRHSGFPSE